MFLQENLLQWNQTTFGNIFKDKKVIHEELERIKISIMNQG